MSPRAKLGLALGAFALLVIAAAVAGLQSGPVTSDDPRRSTFLTGPSGSQGLTDALSRLGVRVTRLKRNPAWIAPDSLASEGSLLAILGPTDALGEGEGIAIATQAGGATDLLLAGPTANLAMRCFGWRARRRLESIRASDPSGSGDTLQVRALLERTQRREYADSSGEQDGQVTECRVPSAAGTERLLVTFAGLPAAVRLTLPGGRRVTLVADDEIFSNRALRNTAAGPFALGLVAGRYRSVVVDEFHQGFGPSGSLAGAVLRWSRDSPWGWAGWQLAAVGLIALLAASRRFGPARAVIDRRRRSPLEHVRALATALAAAGGHDLAVRLLVQGLRRRLARGTPAEHGRALRADPRAWLGTVARRARTPAGRAAADELLTLTSQPQSPEGVLRAADLVEDLWTDLTPSPSATK
jgi:hypothetical protein